MLIPHRADQISWKDFGHSAVLVDRGREEVLELNPTAGAIWALADGSRSIDEIATEVAGIFRVEWSAVYGDTIEFLEQLETAELLNWVEIDAID